VAHEKKKKPMAIILRSRYGWMGAFLACPGRFSLYSLRMDVEPDGELEVVLLSISNERRTAPADKHGLLISSEKEKMRRKRKKEKHQAPVYIVPA
jgi:hypothetical protein